ncbi:MAG: winged helix DNA-binding protein [Promethearchaeota archaeon]
MANVLAMNNKLFVNMPPSSKKVYNIILAGKQMRFKDITEQTKYSTRTVRYALRDLKDAGLIGQIPDMMDLRRCYYTLR